MSVLTNSHLGCIHDDGVCCLSMECVVCALLSCVPGFYSGGCVAGSTRDASCLQCSNGPMVGVYEWKRGCEYQCASGYYRVNNTLCMPCSEPQCRPGFHASECSDSSNRVCVECILPVSGPLNWINGCEYVCADGYFLNGVEGCLKCAACFPGFQPVACTQTSDCLPSVQGLPIVMASVVVRTELTMDNTIESVCNDLVTLLRVLNEVVVRVTECGCLRFMTSVTSFNGEACVDNACPQCHDVSRRLLMSTGVSLETISTSIDLMPINAIQQAHMTPSVLQTELILSLAVAAPGFVPASVNSTISSVPLPAAPPEFHGNNDKELVGLIVVWMIISMLAGCIVCVLSCLIYSRFFGERGVALKQHSLEKEHVYREMKPQWMPSIRVKQRRSGSRDRVVDV